MLKKSKKQTWDLAKTRENSIFAVALIWADQDEPISYTSFIDDETQIIYIFTMVGNMLRVAFYCRTPSSSFQSHLLRRATMRWRRQHQRRTYRTPWKGAWGMLRASDAPVHRQRQGCQEHPAEDFRWRTPFDGSPTFSYCFIPLKESCHRIMARNYKSAPRIYGAGLQ